MAAIRPTFQAHKTAGIVKNNDVILQIATQVTNKHNEQVICFAYLELGSSSWYYTVYTQVNTTNSDNY